MTPDHPRVTVAIPLHRSAPFAEVVSANIDRLPHDVEIVISDRTLHDDTIDLLEVRHGGDDRLRFVRRADGLGWVDHYNELLRDARGEYFMWMPHDDDFPSDYVPLLTATLDGDPAAILACGAIRAVEADGTPRPASDRLDPPPIPTKKRPRLRHAFRLRRGWDLAVAFRGLMRREEILRRRLWIRHKVGDEGADISWVFAVASIAPIAYEPRCTSVKRFHPSSAHAAWRLPHPLVRIAAIPVVLRYFVAARMPRHDSSDRPVRHGDSRRPG